MAADCKLRVWESFKKHVSKFDVTVDLGHFEGYRRAHLCARMLVCYPIHLHYRKRGDALEPLCKSFVYGFQILAMVAPGSIQLPRSVEYSVFIKLTANVGTSRKKMAKKWLLVVLFTSRRVSLASSSTTSSKFLPTTIFTSSVFCTALAQKEL